MQRWYGPVEKVERKVVTADNKMWQLRLLGTPRMRVTADGGTVQQRTGCKGSVTDGGLFWVMKVCKAG